MSDAVFAKVKAYLDARDKSKPSTVPHVFKFVVTSGGAVTKTIVVDLVNFTIKQEDGAADVTVTLDEEWIKKIFTLEVDVSEVFKSGKAAVEGDKELLQKLKPFLAKLNSA